MIQLHWFRNDIRLSDNPALHDENSSRFLPVYVIDPRMFEKNEWEFPKTGSYKAKFLLESLKNLKESLQEYESDLLIRVGYPEDVIPNLLKEYDVSKLTYQKEDTWEEIQIEKKIKEQVKCKIETYEGHTLFHPDDIPFSIDKIPNVFTAFRKKLEAEAKVRNKFELPQTLPQFPSNIDKGEVPDLKLLGVVNETTDKRAVMQFKGGETAATDRLKNYFWETKNLKNYKFTRNGMLGESYSSKFSPWLALGCISPRQIYYEVKNFEEKIEKNVSTYWLIFELIWRDYFRFIAKKYGRKIFHKSGIKGINYTMDTDKEKFEEWRLGKTGNDFIDANMKELLLTGFMSNRGRQNVASYFSKDMNMDWRMGAAWFENRLIDYDPCSNWGNWMYVAGVGNDPRDRKFNIQTQRKKYDSKNEYVNYWLENEPTLFNRD